MEKGCGIGAVAEVRTLPFEAGMEADDIEEGRGLLLDCLAAPSAVTKTDTPDAQSQPLLTTINR